MLNWIKTKLFTVPITWFVFPYRYMKDIWKLLFTDNEPEHHVYTSKEGRMLPKLAMLLELVKLAGDKLPQVWPHLIIVYNELAIIASILFPDSRNVGFQDTADSAAILEKVAAAGLSEDEARAMVEVSQKWEQVE